MAKDKLERLLDIIDEASALLVLDEDRSIIFDHLHEATEITEELLADDAKEAKANNRP